MESLIFCNSYFASDVLSATVNGRQKCTKGSDPLVHVISCPALATLLQLKRGGDADVLLGAGGRLLAYNAFEYRYSGANPISLFQSTENGSRVKFLK